MREKLASQILIRQLITQSDQMTDKMTASAGAETHLIIPLKLNQAQLPVVPEVTPPRCRHYHHLYLIDSL